MRGRADAPVRMDIEGGEKKTSVGGGKWQQLLEPMLVVLRDAEGEFTNVYTVPQGFVSEGASIPRAFYALVGGRWGQRYDRAAIFHDWLYRRKSADGVVNPPEAMTRHEADDLFLWTLAEEGCSWFVRTVLYMGVRVGGWASWRK